MRAGQWEVFATSEKFPGTPTGWMQVPSATVLLGPNPVGVPIAWILRGRIFCFAPSNGG
jgi:hypothetical protein